MPQRKSQNKEKQDQAGTFTVARQVMRNRGFKFTHKRKFHRNRPQDSPADEPNAPTDTYRNRRNFAQLKELDLGITEYVSPMDHFVEGIIKSRYSDFHVNEIDLEGQQATLSNIAAPEMPKLPVPELSDLECVKQGLITIEILHSIKEMCDKTGNQPKDSVLIDVSRLDKDGRSKIHENLKSVFRKRICASTLDKGEQKVIEVKRHDPKRKGERVDWDWPEQYVHFLLYKENIDTVQAISALAQSVRTRPGNFNYAGTKDKRAKTTQWVSVRQMEPERLVKATKRLHLIFVGNFSFADKPLKLGMLKGNRFRIAIRQVTTPEDKINKYVQAFREHGFINYYGTQRFGNSATVPTFEVGKALVRQNFKEACELIMKPREGESKTVDEMRKLWWETRKAQEAREKLPKWSTFVEAKLLDGFIKTADTDFLGALNHLPRNMRLLYMHSYQSLLWNKVASRRIREKGLQPIVGDLVYIKDEDEIRKELDMIYAVEELPEDAESTAAESEEPEDKTEKNVERDAARTSFFKSLVRPLRPADLGKYTIYDVVLPLVGHDITYPENEVKRWYTDLLKEDNLTPDNLKSSHKIYSLAGTYRKLMIKPERVEWCVRGYDKPDENLILSDIESLRGDTLPTVDSAPNKALILDFILPPSTYATMALREILKRDTSPAAQIAQEAEIQADEPSEPAAKKARTEE